MRIFGVMRVIDWGLRADRVGRIDGICVGNLFHSLESQDFREL